VAETQIMDEKITALKEQVARTDRDLQALVLKAPITGTWVAPNIHRIRGEFMQRGRKLGIVANLKAMTIRAIAGQKVAARLIKEVQPVVSIRVKGRPDIELSGRIKTIMPAGHELLPSAALGYAAGGATQTDQKDIGGRRTVEPFFEILVIPSLPKEAVIRPGQIVVLQFETTPKPLIAQGWRTLLQLFQKRFHI
jgi:putative peptide zinc metalloprotease protein